MVRDHTEALARPGLPTCSVTLVVARLSAWCYSLLGIMPEVLKAHLVDLYKLLRTNPEKSASIRAEIKRVKDLLKEA